MPDLQAAWDHVRENDGCAGVDGVTVERFARQAPTSLPELLAQAAGDEFVSLPLRQLIVEKAPGGKQRVLMIPVVRERVLQTLHPLCCAASKYAGHVVTGKQKSSGVGLSRLARCLV